MKGLPQIKIAVRGFTDDVGSEAIQQAVVGCACARRRSWLSLDRQRCGRQSHVGDGVYGEDRLSTLLG